MVASRADSPKYFGIICLSDQGKMLVYNCCFYLCTVHVETDIGMLMLTINTNDGQSLSDKHKELLSELKSEAVAAAAQMGKKCSNPKVFKPQVDKISCAAPHPFYCECCGRSHER